MEKFKQRRVDETSPGVSMRPGAVAHSLQVVVDVVPTVEVEVIWVNVDLDTGVEAVVVVKVVLEALAVAPVLPDISPGISVAVVTSNVVLVRHVHSVYVAVPDNVVTVVSVVTQLVLTVTDTVTAGRGELVKVPDTAVTLPEKEGVKVAKEVLEMGDLELPEAIGPEIDDVTLPDIAAPDGLIAPAEAQVENTSVLVLSTVYDPDSELGGLAPEATKVVSVEVPLLIVDVLAPVGSGAEVSFPREKGVGIPFSETVDVLVVKKRSVLVVTDVDSSKVEVVTFDNVAGEDAEAVRVLVSLVLTGIPVALVADVKFAVQLPTGSDTLVVVYGTEVVSCGTDVSVAVVLVKFPDGGGSDANVVVKLGTDPLIAVEEVPVTKGTVGEESELDNQGAVAEVVVIVEALVENEFIKVILVEDTVSVNVLPLDVDGRVMTNSVEVEVVVLMANVVTTETDNSAPPSPGEDPLCRLDNSWTLLRMRPDISFTTDVEYPVELLVVLETSSMPKLIVEDDIPSGHEMGASSRSLASFSCS